MAGNLDIAAWDDTLLAVLHATNHPPLFGPSIVQNHNLVSHGHGHLIIALGHKVVQNLTLLITTATITSCNDFFQSLGSDGATDLAKGGDDFPRGIFGPGVEVDALTGTD